MNADTADWTTDPETGRANSSRAYVSLVETVDLLLRDGAAGSVLVRSWTGGKAGLIMAQLAHIHHLAPAGTIYTADQQAGAEVTGFCVGDRVRPLPDEVMCRQGEQAVVAVYSHPMTGDWLWLVADDGVVGSFAARFWEHVPLEGES